jgi:hypothetical protein
MDRLAFAFRARFLAAICSGSALICFTASSVGQSSQAVDRAELARSQPTPSPGPQVEINNAEGGQAIASPNDADLGVQQILKRTEEYEPFTLTTATPIYYTSNVALVRTGEVDDLINAPVSAAYYDPRITKTLYGHLGVREQFFFYDTYTSFDFGSFDFEAGANYYLPQFHNLILRFLYDYNRLTTRQTFNAFFQNHGLLFNAELPVRFGRAQHAAIGIDENFSVAGQPDGPRRHEHDVYVGYGANITRSFSVDGAGRVVVRNYVVGGRTDISEIFSLNATYRIRDWFTASAISSFATNQSNQSVFEYDVANIGGAVSLTFKF